MMGLAVAADQAGSVYAEHSVQLLQRHVVYEHVEASLQEGRIHRKHGYKPLLSHSSRHGAGVALGNAYIEETVREFGRKAFCAGTARHCRGYGDNAFVVLRELAKILARLIGKAGRTRRKFSCFRIKSSYAVVFVRMGLRVAAALSLHGKYVQHDRLFHILGKSQRVLQLVKIMSVDRPQIAKAHLAEHISR